MKTLFIIPTGYYLLTQPIDGVTFLFGILFIILAVKIILGHIDKIRLLNLEKIESANKIFELKRESGIHIKQLEEENLDLKKRLGRA